MDDLLTATRQEFLELDDEDAITLITARYQALDALGFDAEAAVILAVHPEIAVAEACDLIRRGCDAQTAVRILL